MSKKLRAKIKRVGKNSMREKKRRKIRYLVVALLLVATVSMPHGYTHAEGCPDVKIVFARGSGEEQWTDQNYLAFRDNIATKLTTTNLSYEFVDLDYPAIGIGDIGILAGTYFSAGEAYEFGKSVSDGVKKLDKMINNSSCSNTKYVLGGYSQGAMVISRALRGLNANKLIYAATFGDPKIYLPEGEGAMPAACRGENLSDYRVYVPDCQAYKGMLGAYIPYEPDVMAGKIGTWCNKRDIMCSSKHWDLLAGISDHTAYVAENLYEDASRVIFDKICKAFGVKSNIASPHDTAILIDSTGSMSSMIEQYKAEALRLAKETLASGGRVALYDYRDLDDPYKPLQHCDFDSCTLEKFTEELEKIEANNGGDTPESLLSASFTVMDELEWKRGATKSLVILTDADYLEPDRDGMTLSDVVRLSKQIDPVNFYIITESKYGDIYAELATATGGKVVTNFDELSLLTDYILERYDSLPRVEEEADAENLPTITVDDVNFDGEQAEIKFTTTGKNVAVIVNDAILGIVATREDGTGSVVVGDLSPTLENTVSLVPLGEAVRGEAVEIKLGEGYGNVLLPASTLPKAPNTGRQ